MIVVTGATGKLGSQIVERLLETVPAQDLGVSVRDTAAASSLEARGVRVRHGDFTKPDTLAHAFEGADRVVVVSAAIRGGSAADANAAAIDAAQAAGATGILYTSHQAASVHSRFSPAVVHAQTEAHLAGSGVPHVALRNGFYASSLMYQVGDAMQTGTLVAPQDGPVSWTAHTDLAEFAARAASADTLHPGATAPLTASEALDLGGVAEILSAIAGREIERVVVDDDEWKTSMVAGGLPPQAVDFMLGQFLAARAGEFAVTDPTMASVNGHPPVAVSEVLRSALTGS